MIPQPPLHADGEVWCCEACRMIGTKADAEAHRAAKGCEITLIGDELADQVREARLRQHDEFVAALAMLGGMKRRADDASSRKEGGA